MALESAERQALLRTFAAHLRRYRKAAGLTQELLAAQIGRSRLFIVKLEGGRREASMVTLTRLAKALKVPVGALLLSE